MGVQTSDSAQTGPGTQNSVTKPGKIAMVSVPPASGVAMPQPPVVKG